MRRITIASLFVFVLATMTASTLRAQNGHYIKLDPSFNPQTACYNVSLKEAGLGGSGFLTVEYALSATATFTTICVNHGGNQVQGQPKSGTGTATQITPLAIRNGSTNGTVSLCPGSFTLPDPGCTGSQRLEITAASYTNVQLNDQLPAGVTAGVQTSADGLADLGGANLSVIVP